MNFTTITGKIDYKKSIFLSILLVTLVVVLINTASIPSMGVVFIAIGGFFLIIGMGRKGEEKNKG